MAQMNKLFKLAHVLLFGLMAIGFAHFAYPFLPYGIAPWLIIPLLGSLCFYFIAFIRQLADDDIAFVEKAYQLGGKEGAAIATSLMEMTDGPQRKRKIEASA